jgi:hypothetical protein
MVEQEKLSNVIALSVSLDLSAELSWLLPHLELLLFCFLMVELLIRASGFR